MIKGILGKKLGMTRVFAADGRCIPVTVVEAGPCVVLQKKTAATDGYDALQLGFGTRKTHRVNQPEMGHFRKVGKGAFAHLREIRAENVDGYQVGDEITCDSVFAAGDIVDVTATSKGKGFQGVIKRHHYSGGPETHGHMFHRAPGSIGSSSFPSRVWKGKTLPGHMGSERVTVQRLKVVEARPEENLLFVSGAVPGARGGLLVVRKSKKA
jgi:large subunit ribosomal protein L3